MVDRYLLKISVLQHLGAFLGKLGFLRCYFDTHTVSMFSSVL